MKKLNTMFILLFLLCLPSSSAFASTADIIIRPPINGRSYEIPFKYLVQYKSMTICFYSGYKTPRISTTRSFYDNNLKVFYLPSRYPTETHKIFVYPESIIDRTKSILLRVES